MSPRLDQETQKSVIAERHKVGMAENAASAVLRSIETVLNDGKEARAYSYREPYEQLPFLDAKS